MGVDAGCAELRHAMSELALGVADGQERAVLLEHAAGCPECRRELEELTALAEELLLLAPEREPPLGFELRTLAAVVPPPRRSHRRRGRHLPLLAAALLASAITSVGLLYAFRDDRRLADHYRATLAQAHGSSFTAVTLRTGAGLPAGTVFAYRGRPSWLLVTIDRPYRSRLDRAELLTGDGRTVALPTWGIAGGSWGGTIPVDASRVRGLHVLDPGGRVLLVASLPPGW